MPPKIVPYDEDLEDVDMDRGSDGEAEDTFDDTEMHQEPHPIPPANPNVLLPAQGQTGYFPNPVFSDQLGVTVSATDNYPCYDDGPRQPNENKDSSEQRIDRASIAMGLERKPVFQNIAKGPRESEKEYHARYSSRYKLKKKAEAEHKKKMNPNAREYDQVYDNYYKADKAGRRQRNAQRRAAALAHRRAHDAANGRPRVATPDPAEDSGDERYASRQYAEIPSRQNRPFRQYPPPGFPQLGYAPERGQFPKGIKSNPPSDRCEPCENDKKECDLGLRGWYPCTRCTELRKEGQCVNGKGRVKGGTQRPKDEAANRGDSQPPGDGNNDYNDNNNTNTNNNSNNNTNNNNNGSTSNQTGGTGRQDSAPDGSSGGTGPPIQQLGYTPKPGKWPRNIRTNPPSTKCTNCEIGKKGTCDLFEVGYPCTPCVEKSIGHTCVNGKGYSMGPKAQQGQGGPEDTSAQPGRTQQRQDQNAQTSAFNEAAEATSSLPIPTPNRGRGRAQTRPADNSLGGYIPPSSSGPGRMGSAPLTGLPPLNPNASTGRRQGQRPAPRSTRGARGGRGTRGTRPQRSRSASPEPTVRDDGCSNCYQNNIDCIGDHAPCSRCSSLGLSCDLNLFNDAQSYRDIRGPLVDQDEDDEESIMPYRPPPTLNTRRGTTQRAFATRRQRLNPVVEENYGNRTDQTSVPGYAPPGIINNPPSSALPPGYHPGFPNMRDLTGYQDMASYINNGPMINAAPPFNNPPAGSTVNTQNQVHPRVVLPPDESLPSWDPDEGDPFYTKPDCRYTDQARPEDALFAHRLAMEALQNPPVGLAPAPGFAPRGNDARLYARTPQEISWEEELENEALASPLPESVGGMNYPRQIASEGYLPGAWEWDDATGPPSSPPQPEASQPSDHNRIARPVLIPDTNLPMPVRALFSWDGSGQQGGPSPNPFQGKLAFKQDWDRDDLAGFIPSQNCNECKGICDGRYPNLNFNGPVCMNDFAKKCDWTEHAAAPNNRHQICDDCHKSQNIFFREVHLEIEQQLRAWTCGDCATILKREKISTPMKGKSTRCECFATLKNRWLCVEHVSALTENMKKAITEMGEYFTKTFPEHAKAGRPPCVNCVVKEANPNWGVWACKVCRMWKHLDFRGY